MLGLGGYHIGCPTEKDTQEVIEAAIGEGILFFETIQMPTNGQIGSSELLGVNLIIVPGRLRIT